MFNPNRTPIQPRENYAFQQLTRFGGIFTHSLEHSAKRLVTRKKRKHKGNNGKSIKDYAGLVVTFGQHWLSRLSKHMLRDQYPHFLFLDYATHRYVVSKQATYTLFQNDPHLQALRPACKLYKKKYTPSLAKTIIKDLASETFVIKPLNAAKGHGVLIVDKNDLSKTLKLILDDHKRLKSCTRDVGYTHWLRDASDMFLVEAYAPSKALPIGGKAYDPTMRVVFVLHNECGVPGVTFLDAYWKLPSKSLEEAGTLTDRHKSHISSYHVNSAPVALDDFMMVSHKLEPVLLALYTKMLARTYGC